MNAQTERFTLQGPAGVLEVARDLASAPDGVVRGTAVIAHPHPWQHLTFLASCVIISITSYKRTVDALRIEGLLSILL